MFSSLDRFRERLIGETWYDAERRLTYLSCFLTLLVATPVLVKSVKDSQTRYQFETQCSNFIQTAAFSPTITIAKQRLDDAVLRCDKFDLTQTQAENLQVLRATLINVPPSASAQEQYFVLRQLQETLQGTF